MPKIYLCSIELADLRFADGDVSATFEKVYAPVMPFSHFPSSNAYMAETARRVVA